MLEIVNGSNGIKEKSDGMMVYGIVLFFRSKVSAFRLTLSISLSHYQFLFYPFLPGELFERRELLYSSFIKIPQYVLLLVLVLVVLGAK